MTACVKCGTQKNDRLDYCLSCFKYINKKKSRRKKKDIIKSVRAAKKLFSKKSVSSQVFYDSDEWKKARYVALKLHGPKCMCCGASRNDGAVLHVDHIKPRSKYPHLSLDINNLQILCATCNLGKGAWDETDFRGNNK